MYKIKLTKIAIENLNKIDHKTKTQIINKIDMLKEYPNLRGKQLKGLLKGYRSIRAAGQRYRIIYKVEENEIIVLIISVGIRKDGDKKDIYEFTSVQNKLKKKSDFHGKIEVSKPKSLP